MKILVLGANGFIGRAVVAALNDSHEVFSASRESGRNSHQLRVDLLNKDSISKVLKKVKPEVVINCAGIVENNENSKKNVEFTKNILDEIVKLHLRLKTIVICGSAAEYGEVDPSDLPAKEDAPLNAANDYGLSKKRESELALDYGREYNLPIVVVRIFNPIGIGMNQRFLISRIAANIAEIEKGAENVIEVSRLDSERDYVVVEDVADSIKKIVEGRPEHNIYNIGSGVSTSNGQLIEMAIKHSRLKTRPKIIETLNSQEPLYAVQADISRIKKDLGWQPKRIIEDTVKEVMNETRKR